MLLMVDIGNTTISWGWHRSNQAVLEVHRAFHERYEDFLSDLRGRIFSEVRICSVASQCLVDFYCGFLSDKKMYFATVQKQCGKIRNGYKNFSQLGVDRWMGVLGAALINRGSRPFYVADSGSALTVDFVDESAVYAGGFILPGWSSYLNSLAAGTAILEECLQGSPSQGMTFGTDTYSCIWQGYVAAVCACVDFEPNALIYLTGGGIHILKDVLSHRKVVCRNDLVFQGMMHDEMVWQSY